MSLALLTAALGLVTTSLAGPPWNLAIFERSIFSPSAQSWLGFLVLSGLAVCSFMAAIVHPEQIAVLNG